MFFLDGSYNCAIDDRGRVRIPSRLLDALGEGNNEQFYINRGLGGHNMLRMFPKPMWDQEVRKIRKNMNPYNQEEVEAARFFFNGAEEVEVDKVERVRIPKMLLEWIDVKGKDQLVINTFLEFIEIWKADEYTKFIEQQKHDKDKRMNEKVLARLTAESDSQSPDK